MTTVWFHCFAGTAGDMTLGALVDAGADQLEVMDIVGRLDLDGYALSFEPVVRCGIASTHAIVVVNEHRPDHAHETHDAHRPYSAIRELLDRADLPVRVKDRAQRVFRLLAEVEGEMHRMDPDDVEFHEVGSVDAIIDVVGTCAALEVLDVDRIVCSTITVGQGRVRAAHGELPNPAPAVTALLARRNVPARGIEDHRELATPTGVALMVALADEFGAMPAMNVTSVGYGAGTRDIDGRPNAVQVVLGVEGQSRGDVAGDGQPVRLLECNVDDVTGEVIADTIAALLAAGAYDAWATPIVMKKGRPATTVSVLCDPVRTGEMREILVAETGTLGVRGSVLERWPQHRDEITVHVDGHPIRVKVSASRVKVEHDDAAAAAHALGIPLRIVIERATACAAESS